MTYLRKAIAAHGDPTPDWVEQLARRCDQTSQAHVAGLVGYSATTLSLVISNRYTGDVAKVEERVRATIMSAEILCPELGAMSLAQCLEWRARADDFKPLSSLHRAMFDACRKCPHNQPKGG